MITDTIPPCANCQRIQAEVDALRAELEALRAAVAQLQRQLAASRKDSSNASKPPSCRRVRARCDRMVPAGAAPIGPSRFRAPPSAPWQLRGGRPPGGPSPLDPAEYLRRRLRRILLQFPDRFVLFVGDGTYDTHETARFIDRDERLALVNELHPDAGLYETAPQHDPVDRDRRLTIAPGGLPCAPRPRPPTGGDQGSSLTRGLPRQPLSRSGDQEGQAGQPA
jgi:hypothetical protein